MTIPQSVQLTVSHQTGPHPDTSKVFRTSVKFCGVEIGHLITAYGASVSPKGQRLTLDFGPGCMEVCDERGDVA